VRLSPLGTSATIWPILSASDDRWCVWSSRWNENWQGIPKYSEETCPSVTLSTTNPTWYGLVPNSGLRCGKPATNRLRELFLNNYMAALIYFWAHIFPSQMQLIIPVTHVPQYMFRPYTTIRYCYLSCWNCCTVHQSYIWHVDAIFTN
jgi:hypothetical protein